jgi:hypothetical protein
MYSVCYCAGLARLVRCCVVCAVQALLLTVARSKLFIYVPKMLMLFVTTTSLRLCN